LLQENYNNGYQSSANAASRGRGNSRGRGGHAGRGGCGGRAPTNGGGAVIMEDPSSSKEAQATPSPSGRSAASPIMKPWIVGIAMMSPIKDSIAPRPPVRLPPNMG
jgi:hypothetical protein